MNGKRKDFRPLKSCFGVASLSTPIELPLRRTLVRSVILLNNNVSLKT